MPPKKGKGGGGSAGNKQDKSAGKGGKGGKGNIEELCLGVQRELLVGFVHECRITVRSVVVGLSRARYCSLQLSFQINLIIKVSSSQILSVNKAKSLKPKDE